MTQNFLSIYAKSFNWAGFFLPKKIYEDSAKLYAFCRVLDDIADEKTNLESKIKRFDEMRNILLNGSVNNFDIIKSISLSILYFVFGVIIFYISYLGAKVRGTLINMGE